MSTAPLLHIGYHKTGSTWLQNDVFPGPEGGFCLPWTRDETLDHIVLPKELGWDADAARRHFARGLQTAAEAGRVPVLSNERFSGNPHVGGYDSRIVAERLARLFPDARVLIVVREQRSMLVSLYKQYVREGGILSLTRYLEPPRYGRARIPGFDFAFLEYHRLCEHYLERFGKSAVKIVPFEALSADPTGFVAQVAEFSGAERPESVPAAARNVGHPASTLWLKRWINFLAIRSTLHPAAPFDLSRYNTRLNRLVIGAARGLPQGVRERSERRLREAVNRAVEGRYEASNRRLGVQLGLDLESLGYAL